MAVQQDRRAALKRLKLLVYAPKLNIDSFRSKIEETFACPVLPNHVDCTDYNYGGVSCDVLSPEIYSSRRIVIYIHGGSFVAGSRASWRGFCARLAAKSFSRVVVPEFRLAPAHPYPAALEDVQAVFRTVYTELQVACSLDASAEKAAAHPEIVIAADGSGASIACALLFSLREKYRTGVSRLVFLSPWLDFSEEAAAAKGKKASDELINGETLLRCGEIYTFVSNLTNPLVSPLYAATAFGFSAGVYTVRRKGAFARRYRTVFGAARIERLAMRTRCVAEDDAVFSVCRRLPVGNAPRDRKGGQRHIRRRRYGCGHILSQ